MPADHGGVGADGLHKGLPHPLEGGLVGRLPHSPLLLRDHWKGEGLTFPGKENHTAARHQVVGHLVQSLPHQGGQVIEGAVAQALEHLVHGHTAQGFVLGQRAQDIVAQALVAGHAQQVTHRHHPLPVPVEVDLPLHKVGAALKHRL